MYRGSILPSGSLNNTPDFIQQTAEYEDYATASFYRVKVTGAENEIRVTSGKGNVDNNDRIIY